MLCTIAMRERPVLLCAALPYECRALADLLRDATVVSGPPGRARWTGWCGPTPVVVQETGMGLAAAEATLGETIPATSPRCVVASGLAGGLAPAVAIGDAIVPDRVARAGGHPIAVDPDLRTAAAMWLPEKRSRRGLLVSVDRVLRTPGEKARLAAATRAEAVDMESAAILEQAARFGAPAIVVRAASDAAGDELPDLAGLDLDRLEGRLRLAGRACLSPRTAAGLVRLARGARRATRTLDEILRNLLPRLQS